MIQQIRGSYREYKKNFMVQDCNIEIFLKSVLNRLNRVPSENRSNPFEIMEQALPGIKEQASGKIATSDGWIDPYIDLRFLQPYGFSGNHYLARILHIILDFSKMIEDPFCFGVTVEPFQQNSSSDMESMEWKFTLQFLPVIVE
jgi:hypothetical protein